MVLAGSHIVRAGQRGIAEAAGVERLLEGQVRGLDVLLLQISGERRRERQSNCFSGRSSPDCRRLRESPEGPASAGRSSALLAGNLEFVLTEQAVLPSSSAYVRTGDGKK